ncbi:hypothetical protein LTR56_024930 [Elasticomyces elasticus]|nr:hypothetical protein LTR56_024930 [Elasticomyces elasticus]KAK3641690.1 hypothetical protein LTR22_016508 [Elasticomyces elasticus]KAK4907960.1 hypothetical protein LTR49_023058 [Elasticomyces elasticus]KAK5741824.1 hypothetical protein LTS12_024460 [Elasticomyces elasticus]
MSARRTSQNETPANPPPRRPRQRANSFGFQPRCRFAPGDEHHTCSPGNVAATCIDRPLRPHDSNSGRWIATSSHSEHFADAAASLEREEDEDDGSDASLDGFERAVFGRDEQLEAEQLPANVSSAAEPAPRRTMAHLQARWMEEDLEEMNSTEEDRVEIYRGLAHATGISRAEVEEMAATARRVEGEARAAARQAELDELVAQEYVLLERPADNDVEDEDGFEIVDGGWAEDGS